MPKFLERVWNGWKLVEVPKGAGGAEARHRRHLVARRRNQIAVLELLNETHPDLVRGVSDVKVSAAATQRWEEQLQGEESGSALEIHNKMNFLSLGLLQGQKKLGWDVVVPAPMRLIRPPTSPFTPNSFTGLNQYRDRCGYIDAAIQEPDFQDTLFHGNGLQGHRGLEPEAISWGLFLYLVITRDGLLSSQHASSLPLVTTTLAMYGSTSWLVMHETVPDDMPGKVPPRSRWILGVQALVVLMRHIEYFGHPSDALYRYQSAKEFTQKSWRQFNRAIGGNDISLSAFLECAGTALRLSVPQYLVNSSRGKHIGTSLSEERWQQLLGGGYVDHGLSEGSGCETPAMETGLAPVSLESNEPNLTAYEGRELLKTLHGLFYKRRDQKRLRFESISHALDNAIATARRLPPIVQLLCRWLLFLHQKKKLKQSTLYTYLGVSMPLLQALGDTRIDQERLAVLVEAYRYVVEQAKTNKNKAYRWSVLRSFHGFLVVDIGLTNVAMEFEGDGVSVVSHSDAQCLSEEEFGLVASSLARCSSAIGQVRYWTFVLGFRAGLRIGEALSIQLDDILVAPHLQETEIILLIRNNVYVSTKSHDSRRSLPLHLLFSESEKQAFKSFVANRRAVARHGRVMLFGEGGESVAPFRDDRVQVEIHTAMRRITGNSNLRFHHLRHSLANYLLLSFHGVEIPWPAPSQHASLWKNVVRRPSRSGLYFIAQVMGHASPDITLRSYLHFTCLLMDHYCHRRPMSVGEDDQRHAIAQLDYLTGIIDIKLATLRKWKQRFGEKPPLWLSKAYPSCQLTDVAQQDFTPYPQLPANLLPERQGLSQLSLEQVDAALNALHLWSFEDIERVFNLCEGEAEKLARYACRILTQRTRRGVSAFRHHRYTAGKHQPDQQSGLPPRLPLPHSLLDRQVSYSMYRAIWSDWFEDNPEKLRRYLRFFYRFHRAVEGHVWIRDVEDGLAFVSWVLSLGVDIRAVIEVTPSARSPLSSKQQLQGWKERLPSQKHKVEWHLGPGGQRFVKELGTGNVSFYILNKNRKICSGYPVRYTLVVTCIVMAALANRQTLSQ